MKSSTSEARPPIDAGSAVNLLLLRPSLVCAGVDAGEFAHKRHAETKSIETEQMAAPSEHSTIHLHRAVSVPISSGNTSSSLFIKFRCTNACNDPAAPSTRSAAVHVIAHITARMTCHWLVYRTNLLRHVHHHVPACIQVLERG